MLLDQITPDYLSLSLFLIIIPESVKFILFLHLALKTELVVDYFNSSIFSIPSLEVILNRISAKMSIQNKALV